MKILLTMNLPYTRIFGGANKSNKSLAEEFAKKGHEVLVVAPALATPSHITHDELLKELQQAGCVVIQEDGCYVFTIEGVKIHAVMNASQLRNKLVQKTLQSNPDWVFISAEDPSQTLLNAAFEAAPEKVIYLAHTPQMFPFGNESMYPGEKRTQVIGKSKLIVTISDFVADYIRSNTGFDVLVNHPPHFGQGPYPNLADFNTGYVLTMNPCGVKGISIFIGLAKALPSITFAYVPGWGTTPSDRKKLEELPNIVRLTNEPDLNDLLKQAKIVLMPTLWSEGFGMATVDAMLRGIPVLASNYGGLKEAKLGTDYSVDINPIQGFTGELDENSLPIPLLPEQNIDVWKKALVELYYNAEEYQRQSEHMYQKAHDFIASLSIDKLEQWLEKHLPGNVKDTKSKIDIKNLTPEQKKKLLLELQKKKLEKQERNSIKTIPKADAYQLSYAQKRLWILDQINQGYYGYIISSGMVLKGDLNKLALQQAFDLVVQKHESLRTYFVTEQGESQQKIRENIVFQLEEKDFSSALDPIDTTRVFARNLAKKQFDLSEAPLLRGALVKIAADSHVLLFAMHHIISDGWSMKVLSTEVYNAYLQLEENGAVQQNPLDIQYKDYATWQNQHIEGESDSKLKNYWYRKLGGELTILNLPTDKSRPPLKTYNGKIIQKHLVEQDVISILQLCKESKISIFSYLTAAVKILLHRYTNQEDIIVGTPTAGRNNAQLENQIGFFVNMLALRDEVLPSDTIDGVLKKVNTTLVEALDNEAYPYDKIVEDLDQNRDLSRSPLFDVMVSIEDTTSSANAIATTNTKLVAENFDPQENEIGSSHDIAFIFHRNDNELSVNLVYNTDLFEAYKGEQILEHISQLLVSIAKNANQKVSEIDYLSQQEKQFLIKEVDSINWPKDKLIHQLFDEVAEKYSDNTAVSCNGERMSYRQLSEKSNQLAHLLKEKGIGRNTIVALLFERSNDMLVAILGVLKAGGTYLPIDPNYPQDRIDYTLSNSQTNYILTDDSLEISSFQGEIISINSPQLKDKSVQSLKYENTPEDIAYIIYTSGSTGWPKGVMISHYNVVRLLFNDSFQFNFNEKDTWTLFHSYCFDFSVWEMYGALLYGGTLIVVPKLVAQSTHSFWQLIQDEKVTVLNQTPGAFYNLIEEAKQNPISKTSIRYIIFGGEALNPKKLSFWYNNFPDCKLINMYGITETTVHVTYKEITEAEIQTGVSNIGTPIPTLQTYILDKQQNLLPVGVAGELCVGGLGLAKGYLNNPELTHSKFITHPFLPNEKLYRSGDLAKLLPNGEMEYLGRIDFQVKIRGFRIELGEIESKLHTYEAIEDCLVIVKKDEQEENYLVAYYVADNAVETKTLRTYLSSQLPDYMIPAFFVHYISFPLNQNGKVDRKSLIDPLQEGGSLRKKEILTPRTETEITLTVLWNEVLNKQESSIDDNFFEVGGHSLKANQLIGKIYHAFEIEIRLGDFFDSPTIQELAEIIEKKKGSANQIKPIALQEFYPMSYAQKRMWILEQFSTTGNAYTMPIAFLIEGELAYNRFEKAFNRIVERHEILRTSFKIIEGKPVQYIVAPKGDVKIPIRTIAKNELEQHLQTHASKVFDLSELPLYHLELLKVSEQEHYLFLNMHHIISDAQSLSVLFQELFLLYQNESTLQPLEIQYKDFSVWQNNLIDSVDAQAEKSYWHEKMGGEIERIEFPLDFKRPQERSFSGANYGFDLVSEDATFIHELAQTHQTSVFVVTLSLLKVFVSKMTNAEDIIIGSPVSGRVHPLLENQIGFYVNTLAFRDVLSGKDTLSEVITKVKRTVNDGLRHQAYPFDLLVEELNIPRDVSRNPLFDIMISMDEENEELKNTLNSTVNDLSISSVNSPFATAKFDLTFGFHKRADSLGVSINYNTDIFAEESIERFATWFQNLIHSLAKNTSLPICTHEILTPKEQTHLIQELNANQLDYNLDFDVLRQIQQSVDLNPLRIALLDDTTTLTYKDIWEMSNVVAVELMNKGIGKDDIVPLMLNRSVYTVACIIGVLKTGAAYVFIDPAYPDDRIAFMLEDCSPKILVTERAIADTKSFSSSILVLEDFSFDKKVPFELTHYSPTQTAYLIFTSGSTGRPKGVMISHKNLNAFLAWAKNEFNSTEAEIVYNATSYSFDLSVYELFYSFVTGKTVRVLKDGLQIANYLTQDKKILINTVPSVVKQLITLNADFSNVVAINIAGEPIPQIVKQSLDFNTIEVRNLYGPSEDTTYSTCFLFKEENFTQNIGKPIANTQAYIIGKSNEILPFGVAGELCLSGDGIANGYLNRKELTSEKFIPHPFGHTGKLYKTGDLVRWTSTNDLEYLGRIDKQIKIRGFRIELEEIERALAVHIAIKDVVVTDLWNENTEEKYLAAYYVSHSGQAVEGLGAFLAEVLPAFMVPSHFVNLELIPISPNGKTDRSRLPNPFVLNQQNKKERKNPVNPIQEMLLSLWQKILGLEEISIDDNFFELGGQSLKAALLVNEIQNQLNASFSITDIFRNTTIEQMALRLEKTEATKLITIPKAPTQSYYPLSSAQNRLFVVSQFDGVGTTYNIPGALRIQGKLDSILFQKALQEVVQRHEALRTSFSLVDNVPVQQVLDFEFELAIQKINEDAIQQELNDFVQPFDLYKGPLFRIKLLQITEEKWVLFYDIHHIIGDGVSLEIIIRDLFAFYHNEVLEPLDIKYKDYAVWQNNHNSESSQKYWLSLFDEFEQHQLLPYDFKRSNTYQFEGAHVGFALDEKTVVQLKALAKKHNITLFMLLFSLYGLMLSKRSGKKNVVIGTPVSGRNVKEVQNMVGMFVNNLAIPLVIDAKQTISEFIQHSSEHLIQCFEHQGYPFEDLVNQLDLSREMGRNPLFDTLFTLQTKALAQAKTNEELQISPIGAEISTSKFDLTLAASEYENQLNFSFEYAKNLFKEETIERLANLFISLVNQVLCEDRLLSEITVLSELDKQKFMQFNATKKDKMPFSHLLEGFKISVANFPTKQALYDGQRNLSFIELDKESDKVACWLVSNGIEKGNVIALLLPRSVDAIVAMLGVVKAGACYLPIDTQNPVERINYYIEDSEAKLVITDSENEYKNNFIDIQTVLSDSSSVDLPLVKALDDAYMIYTSGSTGLPKGVKNRHESIVNSVLSQLEPHRMSEKDNFSQFSSYSFDASVFEIWMSLLSGSSMYILSEETRKDTTLLTNFFVSNHITSAFLPPVMLSLLSPDVFPELRIVFVGGEALKIDEAQKWESVTLVNMYGPTEAAVLCTSITIEKNSASIPLGHAIYNTEIYLLNEDLEQVPYGVEGEICIAGIGVANGYHNRPELNNEKFIKNTFSDYPLLYRTGDLGKLNEDHQLEFLGRIDQQVKVRGYRIELGEIENKLLLLPQVKQTAVTVIGEKDKKIVAYLVLHQNASLEIVKESLANSLPDYMIPSAWIEMDSIPVTISGKVNYKQLPAPQEINRTERVLPQNEIQTLIYHVWAKELQQADFGITDNFFQLGGNSILAMKTVSVLAMDFEIRVNQLFENPTIEQLSKVIHYAPQQVEKKLHQLKELFEHQSNLNLGVESEKIQYLKNQINIYRSSFKHAQKHTNDYQNIMITGSLGFLGMHLIQELLSQTDCQLFLLVRSKNGISAKERLNQKALFYFKNEDFFTQYANRIELIEGDITQVEIADNFIDSYQSIDCIIHAAANTSHFGDWEDFDQVNIKGTENILRFAAQIEADIHYISTLSVAGGKTEHDYLFFSENDIPTNIDHGNYYIQSKIEAEKMLKAQNQVNVSIYRVGNLMPSFSGGVFQENTADNAFMNTLKFYFELGKIPNFKAKIYDFSFIDEVAKSIRLLINNEFGIYHLSNSNKINDVELGNMIAQYWESYQVVKITDLISEYLDNIQHPTYASTLQAYIAHSKVLETEEGLTKFHVSTEKTQHILRELGFEWKKVNANYITKMLSHLEKTGFIKIKENKITLK
jgi:tyrocidine synthetase III